MIQETDDNELVDLFGEEDDGLVMPSAPEPSRNLDRNDGKVPRLRRQIVQGYRDYAEKSNL